MLIWEWSASPTSFFFWKQNLTREDIEWTMLVKKMENAEDDEEVVPGAVVRE